jgi:hypothetical protein
VSEKKKPSKRPRPKKKPEPKPPPIEDGLSNRSGMRLLQRAVREGWQIPEQVYKGAPVICAKILWNERLPLSYRLRASEVLASMGRDKLNAAIALDRMERLDANQATERVVVTPEIRELADKIIARRLGNDA